MNKTGTATLDVFFLVLLAVTLFPAAVAQAAAVQPLSSPVIIATLTSTSTSTPPPTPIPSATAVPNVSLDYSEVNQTTEGSEIIVVLHLTATYNFGGTVNYDF